VRQPPSYVKGLPEGGGTRRPGWIHYFRHMKSVLAASAGAALLIAAGLFACALLPERYAVNAPMLNMMSGWFGASAPSQSQFGTRLGVPAGFSIGLFAEKLPSVRFLRPLPGGGLLATTPREGNVWLLTPDRDGDGRADATQPLIERLNRPHGMDLLGDWLYVAEGDGVGRVRIDPETGELRGDYERVIDGLPAGGNHWTRTVRFGPDGWMYVSVGSSCNVCVESDNRRAAMLRFRPDGREPQIFATGLRNSVGFDWQPGTNTLYATDNGRDLLGDDFPPCELNLVELGKFYGWPIANGDRVPDPNFGSGQQDRIRKSIPPVHAFGAHTAPLGIVFLRHSTLPGEWRRTALVALHGSWNRTSKSGYKVVSLHWGDDGTIAEREFLVGFEQDENVIGRPVDVAEGADGTIYVSDDYANSVYWVKYGAPAR
jgi:glucose/arabinose dehydrogenase